MKRLSGLFVLFLMAGLLPLAPAHAATTYEVTVGQDFFEVGLPGFSSRFYPGSIQVHEGDTLHFQTSIGLGPGGVYPQEWMGENALNLGDPWFLFVSDPDEGAGAVKFNPKLDEPSTCGTAPNPCSWDGSNTDLILAGTEEEGAFVTIDAAPGTTLWTASNLSSSPNLDFKVEVVAANATASTQADLDSRAADLMSKDREDAFALDARMNGRQTSHVTDAGQKVFDVFVGASSGPISFLASYPNRVVIPKGGRVQYHFMDDSEPHTATLGGSAAKDLLFNGFLGQCDPDGDQGSAPDTDPDFSNEAAPCPAGSVLETDVDNRVIDKDGNGNMTSNNDLESSGLKWFQLPDGGTLDAAPWTVRFSKANAKGYKFVCLIHGGFMGGKIVVK
jgi:hypothetical protein